MRKSTILVRIIHSFVCFFVSANALQRFNLEIGYLLPSQQYPSGEKLDILHAVRTAVDDINNNKTLLGNISVGVNVKKIESNVLKSCEAFMELLHNGVATVLGDRTGCITQAAVSNSWNVPIVSHVCGEHELSDKRMYSTFARTHPSDYQVVKSILALIQHFEWTEMSIIVENEPSWLAKATLMDDLAQTNDYAITSLKYYFDDPFHCCLLRKECCHRSWCSDILELTKDTTRVYVFLGSLYYLITCLRTMELMFTNNFVVIYYDEQGYNYKSAEDTTNYLPAPPTFTSTKSQLQPLENDRDYWGNNWEARLEQVARERMDGMETLSHETIQCLLVVTVQLPVANFKHFSRRVRSNVYKLNRYEDSSLPIVPDHHASTYSVYAYDAVMLYALSLHEILKDRNITVEEDVVTAAKDGRMIFNKIVSMKGYKSVLGNMVSIDNSGDPEFNFAVVTAKPADSINRISLSKKNLFPLSRISFYGYFKKELHNKLVFHPFAGANTTSNLLRRKTFNCYNCETFRFHDDDNLLEGQLTVLVVLAYVFIVATSLYIFISCLIEKRNRMKYFNISLSDKNKCLQNNEENSSRYESICNNVPFHPKDTVTQTDFATIRIKDLGFPEKRLIKHETLKEIRLMSKIHNENINRFIGVIVEPRRIYLMTEHCSRGSLADILVNKAIKVDTVLLYSFVSDILCGLTYLANTALRCHGNLKSSNCVVTRNWVLQVTDFGLHKLRQSSAKSSSKENVNYERMLWRAPELLRHPNNAKQGTQKGDVYAFGILLHEIIGRQGPFGIYQTEFPFEIKEIVEMVKQGPKGDEPPYRPPLQVVLDSENVCPHYLFTCMTKCWSENSEDRPSLAEVSEQLACMKKRQADLVDELLDTMAKYTDNLEDLVVERNRLLIEETQKIDDLLTRMYPKSVVTDLTNNSKTVPEKWDSVTMLIIDIVDFTKISSRRSPMGILVLLDDVYTIFDSLANGYAVSKMETIGDAYVAASLLRNSGENHVGEIASLALDVLAEVHKFKLPPREDPLLVRIGIHTGPAVTGVVGNIMPSYSIFGQTVSVASKMESTGKQLQIQISETSHAALKSMGGYVTEKRVMENKGVNVNTYWLTGRTGTAVSKRTRCAEDALPLCYRLRTNRGRTN